MTEKDVIDRICLCAPDFMAEGKGVANFSADGMQATFAGIAALPLDDFEGKSLRYSREKKIIYSVGWNTIDDGGVERNARKERLDVVFKLEF